MKKSSDIFFLFLFLIITLFNSEKTSAQDSNATKMDAFTSKTGMIIKFTDLNLTALRLSYGQVAQRRIRKISIGVNKDYFYQIEMDGTRGKSVASIQYDDLVEIAKALTTLIAEVNSDVASRPDYMENKFTTEDGFQLGYYVQKGKATWFLQLEQHGASATIQDGPEMLEATFVEARKKIDELKK